MYLEVSDRARDMQKEKETHQAFLLFCFSFSLRFTAFLSRASSSCTLTPSTRAPALSHFSRSARAARSSSGKAASFSLWAASCESACAGFDAVVGRFFLTFALACEEDAPAEAKEAKVTEVNFELGS